MEITYNLKIVFASWFELFSTRARISPWSAELGELALGQLVN